MQVSGAIIGALLVAGLMPNTYVGMGDGAPGRWAGPGGVSLLRLSLRDCSVGCLVVSLTSTLWAELVVLHATA